ncbi:hypothetical protein [Pseudomonas sp. 1928-m]|uniref:hypothetical protein n=1 Tax=Pseudomonas sp. 1928-m TaxID=3033804 RepID=UPI0023DFFE45|nr:hypothetical protein [Pseudomonas sp. 1928-m]MDF3195367.1 hypothetical protein [Pseudomonas sp. 1928-m]
MKKIIASLITFFIFNSIASAHEDTSLPISADGSISGIPPEFGAAKLDIEFSKESTSASVSKLELRIGGKSLLFPTCLSSLLETKKINTVIASGSWYHDESNLPYYLSIKFHDSTYNPKTWVNTGYSILVNLRENTLISMNKYEILDGGMSYQEPEINLKSQCTESELKNFPYHPVI